ncbi:hypothetical protein RSAG8_05685, partial [Rhizoctonia solani AG-8 WAC10335]
MSQPVSNSWGTYIISHRRSLDAGHSTLNSTTSINLSIFRATQVEENTMPRRTSARLAKARGKRAKVDTEEIYDDIEHDADFELVESEKEEQQPPPQKRQRTVAKTTNGSVRKKQVRGKQGLLADLVNMPIDIFTELHEVSQIASHLLPGDIISLARSNKFFRNLLMHRSAIHIWHGTMRNVEGLPPCPPELSEPHYLSLLFSKTCSEEWTRCSLCGSVDLAAMQSKRLGLLESLPNELSKYSLMPLDPMPIVFMALLPYSESITPPKRRSAGAYVLREDFQRLVDEYEEKKRFEDKSALNEWMEHREEMVHKRQAQAQVLAQFLSACELDREQELFNTKAARRSEIKRRLTEMGWTDEDMEFSWGSINQHAWNNLVSQPKPLTDRGWTSIRPKLIPLLQANREKRLNAEREARRRSRRARLSELILGIKSKNYPALEFKVQYPVAIRPKLIPLLQANREKRLNAEREARRRSRRARLSELILGIKSKNYPALEFKSKNYPALEFKVQYPVPSVSLPTINISHQPPFPDLVYILDWPIVNGLYETDSTVTEMEVNFEAHRAEIETLIADWASETQAHFIKMLRDGPDVQGDILRPTTIVSDDGPDPFINISTDALKRLLRADSLFYKTTTPSVLRHPLTYGSIFSGEGFVGSYMAPFWPMSSQMSLNLDHIRLYREAQEVAREILADMGRPDASYLEMKGVGPNFVCGRCHDTNSMTWEQFSTTFNRTNYMTPFKRDHRVAVFRSGAEITYNNVHNPALNTDRPMVKYFSVGDADDEADDWSSRPQVCKLCERIPAAREVCAFETTILRHLRDVHGITKPKADEHYAAKKIRSELVETIHYDSDESDLSHWGCGCEYDMMFDDGDFGYGYYDEDDDVDPGNVFDYDDDVPGYLSDEDEYDWW